MVLPRGFPRLIPAIPSNLVYEFHQQRNDVEQIHEKHYEFYASGVAVRDDRQRIIFSLRFLNGPINRGDNFVPFPNRMVLLLGLIRMKTWSPTS